MSLLPFVGPILDIVRRVIPDKEEQSRLENALRTAAMESDARFAEAQAKVIQAEAQGESWLQRNWRPMLMFLLMGVIVWHALAVPLLAAAIGVPMTELVGLSTVPNSVWTLLTVGMGGYIGGRTLEKVMKG